MGKNILRIENKKGVDITPGMIGLFYEDINYCCDGGINAEMIENASFEFVEAMGCKGHYSTKYDGLYGWIPFPTDGDGAELSIGTDKPVHKNNPHYAVFKTSADQRGFCNKAYDGICLKKGEVYTVSAYLRKHEADSDTRVAVSVYDGDRQIFTKLLAEGVTDEWIKYETRVTAAEDIRHGRFVIELAEEGSIEADLISMKPENAVFGVFRPDIVNLLKDMRPGFLRFPGGCIVEGNELSNRYEWKKTVGAREERAGNWNRWAVHNNPDGDFATGRYSHYNQSYDIGYYEYFLLCEYIGARPLPVQNVGLACQYQSSQLVAVDSPEFQNFIDDVLDLIEFANGSPDSRWGAVRASMGHTEPFGLEMIGIGNEQWETERVDFFERYTLFENAIHERYPDIKLIGSAGPDVTSGHYRDAWEFYRNAQSGKPSFAYAVDEHYYRPVEWFYENNRFYDAYPRDVKVFAGEYAAHTSGELPETERNTLDAALSEAAFLTGVERNADVVVLASYAPLFSRLGYSQWSPDMIWFDDAECYGTPSYYVQKMYACNMGTYTLVNSLATENDRLYQTVSYDAQSGELIIKLVNAGDTDEELVLDTDSTYRIAKTAEAAVLAAAGGEENKRAAVNSIDNPLRVCESVRMLDMGKGVITAEACSFTVVRIKTA